MSVPFPTCEYIDGFVHVVEAEGDTRVGASSKDRKVSADEHMQVLEVPHHVAGEGLAGGVRQLFFQARFWHPLAYHC